MRIQHNIMAMNAYRNYTNNTSALSKNLEKLSSGYRINRAGDDAAGLAISEKMRAQITGLSTAQKNAKDGISLIQTAEGALTEVHDMLNRMVELADQSANGTYDNDVDRANLQKEFDALRSEIDRISKSTNFNGINLLDGTQEAGRDMSEVTSFTAADLLPTTGNVLGTNTILHTDTKAESKTSFSIDLHDLSYAAADDTLSFTIGNGAALDITTTAGMDAEGIATAFVAAHATATIGGQTFNVTADGTRLNFAQANAPTDDTEVVTPNLSVSITATAQTTTSSVTGTAGKTLIGTYTNGAGGGGVTAAMVGTNVTATSTITTANIATVANGLKVLDSGAVNVKKIGGDGADANKLGLYIGDTLIGKSDADVAALGQNTNKVFTFTGLDTAGTSMGTITFTSAAPGAPTDGFDADAFNDAVDTGFDFTPNVANKTLTASGADNDKLIALAEAAGAESGEFKVGVSEDGSKYQLMVGDKVIAEATFNGGGAVTFQNADSENVLTITPAGTPAATDITAPLSTGLSFAAAGTTTQTGDWNVATTNNVQGNVETAGRLASTGFTLDADHIKDGHGLTIGDTTYVFKVGANSTTTAAAGQVLVDLSDLEDGDANMLDTAGTRLSQAAQGNTTFSVGHDGAGVMRFVEREDYTGTDLGSVSEIAAKFSYRGVSQTGNGLTLQIGDTSDSHNQLTVNIQKMDSASLGAKEIGDPTLADVTIADQTSAKNAVDVIKQAINDVSGTRGDLGALQNRLEHTINNLSVMQENIQDAESTIRDVDVAEEMMAYTKNNILVQSAQAMLAQANQLPQGVLQLLQ